MITHIGRLLFAVGIVLGVALAAPSPRWQASLPALASLAEEAKGQGAVLGIIELRGVDKRAVKALSERVLQGLATHGVQLFVEGKSGPMRTHGLNLDVDEAGLVRVTVVPAPKAEMEVAPSLDPARANAAFPLDPTWPHTLPVWALFAFLAAVGAGLWRYGVKQQAKLSLSEGGDDDNPFSLLERLLEPARKLGEDLGTLDEATTLTRVDELLDGYVLPFALVRQKIIDALGMKTGSEILVTVAYGERMLNRVWSAASDDHMPEARASFPDSLAAFEEAALLAQKALQPPGGGESSGTGGPSGVPFAAKSTGSR
jgi:hypothetical protein